MPTLSDILESNPCPSVNPYIVAEYRLGRIASRASALDAYRAAVVDFLAGDLACALPQSKHRDLSLYKPTLTNKTFEAHGYRVRWIENLAAVGLEFVDHSDKIYRHIDHNGWFADAHQETVYRGAVLKITGTRKFLAAYECPDNWNSYLVNMGEVFTARKGGEEGESRNDAMEAAAKEADRMAEVFAEEAREYDEAWTDLRAANDQVSEARGELKGAVERMRELRDTGLLPDLARNRKHVEHDLDLAWAAFCEATSERAEKLMWAKHHGITLADVR